jgi:hypothetical protein
VYYVLGTGGQKYGPADIAALRQWVVEGRVSTATMLEDGVTGRVFSAVELTGLFDAPAASPATPNPYNPPAAPGTMSTPYNPTGTPASPYSPVSNPGTSQPYSPVSGMGQVHPANTDPKTGLPLQSPYVRYDAQKDFSRQNSVGQAALVLLILSFVCFWWQSLYGYGVTIGAIVCAVQAKRAGHEKGQLYFVLSLVSLGLKLVSLVIVIALAASGRI